MLITEIVKTAFIAKKFRGNFSDRITVFLTLTRLIIKSKYFQNSNKDSIVNEKIFKNNFSAYSYSTIKELFYEVFIFNEYHFTTESNCPIIIDCGANIGMSIIYFKRLYPNSKILGFEANPYTFKLLKDNIETNDLKNVTVNNIALYDKAAEISFYIGDYVGTLLGSIHPERGGANEFKVKAQLLSSYLEKFDSVDLIKIDVEGAEIKIIDDLFNSKTLFKSKEYIIEYHHNLNESNSSLSAFLEKFEKSGYRYNIKTTYNHLKSFQDVLIHFYKSN